MTARGTISDATTSRLWVLAGARCEYHGCNKYLLEDPLTAYQVNLAERAHIVGATTGAGSPRGNAPLAAGARNEGENLMLLCRDHHWVIDRLIEEHGVDGLQQMKRAHEARIRLLTGLQDNTATVVVRMFGGIRDAPVGIPREAIQAAVVADGRFPRFSMAMAGEDDLEIDLRSLPDEGTPEYWEMGRRIIVRETDRLRTARESIRHLSVFALARIPLLVALGFYLDDKVSTVVYGRDRGGAGDGGWGYDPEAEPVSFDARPLIESDGGSQVAVAISVTAPIGADVAEQVKGGSVYEVRPRGVSCGRDLLSSRMSLNQFADAYHLLLGRIEADHPGCEVIDLYAAVPVAGAVQIGRGVMRDSQPALRVHDRESDGTFIEAMTLGRRAE